MNSIYLNHDTNKSSTTVMKAARRADGTQTNTKQSPKQ